MGKRYRWLVFAFVGLSSCDPTLAGYCAPGTPECTPVDGGLPDATWDVQVAADGAACNGAQSPSQDPCVIDERYGVFVSPTGSDGSAGSRSTPVATIGHGMDVAKAAGKRVYVCAGTFADQLVVGVARDGVSVYGGLDCTTWTYSTSNQVLVAPGGTGYALELDSLQSGVTFEDVEFDAQSASNPGQSSIAVFASASKNVVLDRVVLVSGNAADGSAGAPPGPGPDGGSSASNWYGTPPNYSELNGMNAGDAGGAPATTCTCPDQSSSTGGAGSGPLNVPPPTAGLPSYGDAGAGAPGMSAVSCGSGGTAQNGANAPIATADTPSAPLGACSASGWTPAMGGAGSNGKPGQGGGGGGNGSLSTGSGGGGACGGCGGTGGKPGAGGGSSIVLLSYQSSITLVSCRLTAGGAGNGGSGGIGEQGQAEGVMGGNGILGGCQGGAGGAGAGGNGGQGGPGGLSLGVGYCGTVPTINGTVVPQAASLAGITLGNAGSAGTGGSGGALTTSGTGPAGANGPAGPIGLAVAVRSLP